MSYKVITIPKFEREIKKLVKKYPSLKLEYMELVQRLKEKPEQGISIGNHCYKIRMAIASKGKGKSAGARVIIYIQISNSTVFLLSIYDKSEKENINKGELKELLNDIPA